MKHRGTRHDYKNTEFDIWTKLLFLIIIELVFLIYKLKKVSMSRFLYNDHQVHSMSKDWQTK